MKKNLGWNAARFASALLALGTICPLFAQTSAQSEVTQAVWKTQQMIFVYRSDTVYYTCPALQDKLRKILMRIGARDDVIVEPRACIEAAGMAQLEVTLHSPVPATQENVRELTTYDSQQVLTALVRGEHLLTAEELPRFDAEWRTISFARDRKLQLEAGDCDLVQQLRRQILPKLAISITYEVQCSIMSSNLGPPRLTVSALVALPRATASH